jgi:chromosome segregation ATPase
MSMFAWMFGRQAELQQEIAQLKEQRDSLQAENIRLTSELVKYRTMQGRVSIQLSSLSNECTQIEERMQQMSEEIDTFQRMVVNR